MRTFIILLFCLVCPIGAQTFYQAEPVKHSRYTGILGELDSHLINNIYLDSDYITSIHESTHGVNSFYRNKYSHLGKINALYCLDKKFLLLREPKVTINQVAQSVPISCRDSLFNLYMRSSSWNNEPLYILDEFWSYTNGAIGGVEVKNWNRANESLGNAYKFVNFAIALDMTARDRTISLCIQWNITRCARIIDALNNSKQLNTQYYQGLMNLQQLNDCKILREFAKSQYGVQWTIDNLGSK